MALDCLPTVSTCCFSISLKLGCTFIGAYLMVLGVMAPISNELIKNKGKDKDKGNDCTYHELGGLRGALQYVNYGAGGLQAMCGVMLLIGVFSLRKTFVSIAVFLLIAAIVMTSLIEILLIVSCCLGTPKTVGVTVHVCTLFLRCFLVVYFMVVMNSFEFEIN